MPKKIVIPMSSLPLPDVTNPDYQVRFRLVSDDRNRLSSWTPIFSVNPDFIYTASGSMTLSKVTGQVTATWPAATVQKGSTGTPTNLSSYDVWVRWHTAAYGNTELGTWSYYGAVSSTSVNMSIPSGMTRFSIEVYRRGRPTVRSQTNGFKLFSSYDYTAV